MRAGLVSAFDISRSYGLVDSAIVETARNPEPDLELVGIRNPLGEGTSVDLLVSAPSLIDEWRTEASRQAHRPAMETGWTKETGISHTEFNDVLSSMILRHPIDRCDLTIFAVGVVYLRIELGPGIALPFLTGVLACFEFAGYRSSISRAIRRVAQEQVGTTMVTQRSEFSRLTERPEPADLRTSKGYEESTIFTSFTGLIRCIDPGDDALIPEVLELLEIEKDDALEFEFHGFLHYDWAVCVLTPRELPELDLEQEFERMEVCIRIAHVFLAACDAYLALFQDEMNAQVDFYVTERGGGRGPEELNKLRTIALALVNLTNFSRVTQSKEDRNYFSRFAEDAHLGETQRLLGQSGDVLFNVQDAEANQDTSRRETVLNTVVILLASLTLISVSADAYNFIRDEEPIFGQRFLRIQLFVQFLVALALIVAIFFWFLGRARRRRRRRGKR